MARQTAHSMRNTSRTHHISTVAKCRTHSSQRAVCPSRGWLGGGAVTVPEGQCWADAGMRCHCGSPPWQGLDELGERTGRTEYCRQLWLGGACEQGGGARACLEEDAVV